MQLPLYMVAQLVGAILASGAVYLLFDPKAEHFYGTTPVGSAVQSFVLEIIISFLLMFVISGVATDTRAVSVYFPLSHLDSSSDLFRSCLADRGISRHCCRIHNFVECPRRRVTSAAFFVCRILLNRICMQKDTIYISHSYGVQIIYYRPISGASMNPARSIGPAIVMRNYKAIWAYVLGPMIGTLAGGFTYNLVRYTDKPLREITKSSSFLKSVSRNR